MIVDSWVAHQVYEDDIRKARTEALEECLQIVIDNESGCGNEWIIEKEIERLMEENDD